MCVCTVTNPQEWNSTFSRGLNSGVEGAHETILMELWVSSWPWQVRDAQGDVRLLKGQEEVAQSCTGAVGRIWGALLGTGL